MGVDSRTTSSNTGQVDVTHEEMKYRFIKLREPQQNEPQQSSPLTGKTLKRNKILHGFFESTYVEAKSVERMPKYVTKSGLELAKRAWTKLKLPGRITAFSKEGTGGYYYLGIGEEASPAQNPTRTTRTGFFLCEGVPLPENEHANFRRYLQENINTKMLWCSGPEMTVVKPENLEVEFRSVGDDHFIIEVIVKMLFGLCFTDHEGPEAYDFEHPYNIASQKPRRVDFDEWKRQQGIVSLSAAVHV